MAKKKKASKKKEEDKKEETKTTSTKKEETKPKAEESKPKDPKGSIKKQAPAESKPPEGLFKTISSNGGGGERVKAMEIRGHGCIVQVETNGNLALQWVPKVHLEEDGNKHKIVMGF